MDLDQIRSLYRWMLTSRLVDQAEQRLMAQGHGSFHVASAGHEAMACIAPFLRHGDFLHLHYRDRALLLARGVSLLSMMKGFLGTAGSHSEGRQMSAHFSDRSLRILSTVGPVGNNALQAVGLAQSLHERSQPHLVVCAVGDGTTQQGEFYEAVADAIRTACPILFVIENNHYAISTKTQGKTFFDSRNGDANSLFGLPILRGQGHEIEAACNVFQRACEQIRMGSGPQLVVLGSERLCDHTFSDHHERYRSREELENAFAKSDPLFWFEKHLDESERLTLCTSIKADVEEAVAESLALLEPNPVCGTKRLLPDRYSSLESNGNTNHDSAIESKSMTMLDALRSTLELALESDSRVYLLGQDIEDPKGDVMGVTRGLSTRFPNRVVNAPLSESTIVGTCVGRALAGQLPIGFIQFADFLPLAFNQIASEMASMYWRTCGSWECPMILMVACGAYKPGLGPFHSQSVESILAHIPGIDVFIPSRADDAAGLLNAALQSGRPTVLLYSKALLNDPTTLAPVVPKKSTQIGIARRLKQGDSITIVSWGATMKLCAEVADHLEAMGESVDLIDLRSISPWDAIAIETSVRRTRRLLVVHEDNRTCGFAAEIIAEMTERIGEIQVKRVVRSDTLLPANFRLQLQELPSVRSILDACAQMLALTIQWASEQRSGESAHPSHWAEIVSRGSGPADSIVTIVEVPIKEGDSVKVGDLVAVAEASKATVDIATHLEGKIVKLLVQVGESSEVGQPILFIEPSENTSMNLSGTHANQLRMIPKISRNRKREVRTNTDRSQTEFSPLLHLGRPAVRFGGRCVSTEEIAKNISQWTSQQAFERTGVAMRQWISDGEHGVQLTADCVEELLARETIEISHIGAILCSTTSPQESTPSISCQIATKLANRGLRLNCLAYDFNAACSGFLYGLRLAYEHLLTSNCEAVIVLTTEVLSPFIDQSDPVTAFLFGDACSATVVTRHSLDSNNLVVSLPDTETVADQNKSIRDVCRKISMDGMAVARAASMTMSRMMEGTAKSNNVPLKSLDYLVPHPGSLRVLKNVASFLELAPERTLSTLRETGNTSSSSIPLVLARDWEILQGKLVGMVAFGAGYTAASALAFPSSYALHNALTLSTSSIERTKSS